MTPSPNAMENPLNLPKNIHTHRRDRDADAVINVVPGEAMLDRQAYSVSIHPWNADTATDESLSTLARHARDPRVVAIGETGIDRLRGPELAIQERLFREHIKLSEALAKPLIIHCVRAYDVILKLKKELRPVQPWIIHGYRGGVALTRQLLAADLYLSIGARYNADSVALIPASRLLHETDSPEREN